MVSSTDRRLSCVSIMRLGMANHASIAVSKTPEVKPAANVQRRIFMANSRWFGPDLLQYIQILLYSIYSGLCGGVKGTLGSAPGTLMDPRSSLPQADDPLHDTNHV